MRSNPIRAAIWNLLEDRPDMEGMTAAEVLDALQGDPSLATVSYHLQVLAKNGRLTLDENSQTEPRYRLAS